MSNKKLDDLFSFLIAFSKLGNFLSFFYDYENI